MTTLIRPLCLAAALLLAGCGTLQQLGLPTPETKPKEPAPVVSGSNAQRLLDEANRLAGEVKAGRMNRTQAADALNQKRLAWVGRNAVDDEVFAFYREGAQDRDQGLIDQNTYQNNMYQVLKQWQKRWPQLKQHPADPAFTNFLMKVFQLPPLQ